MDYVVNHTFIITYPINPSIWESMKEGIRMAQEKAASQDDLTLNSPPGVVEMSTAELEFLEGHNQAVIEWQREFSDAAPEKQREMLGWDKVPTEKSDPGEWIQMTPMVRVLLEMPEGDALWLRNHLARRREEDPKHRSVIGVDDGFDEARGLEMHIREILIYG
jgi:hypothetical protein